MKKLILLALIAAMALSACSLGKPYSSDKYLLELELNKSDIRILQLTDTHLGDKDDLEKHYKFMDLTIKDANPDFIVVTGDLFTFASQTTAYSFFNYLDSHEIPWTVTLGNHDEQVYFSIDWMTSALNNFNRAREEGNGHCYFKDIQDDNVHGNANFAINLMKDGKIFEQLIIMDSNRYLFGKYFGYDCFKKDQIKWYSDLIDYTTAQNEGVVVPSLMFYHIPLPEINAAYEESGLDTGKNEDTCPPDEDYHFFNIIKEKNSTTAMYFGHDHVNQFVVEYEGIKFAYGVKATDRVYYNENMLGGQLITLHDDHTTTEEQIFHKYSEVK